MTEGLMRIVELLLSKIERSVNSDAASSLQVSANGTTSVPPDALARTLRTRFAELRDADARAHHDHVVGDQ